MTVAPILTQARSGRRNLSARPAPTLPRRVAGRATPNPNAIVRQFPDGRPCGEGESLIALTRGLFVLVDVSDLPLLAPYRWSALSTSSGFYAVAALPRPSRQVLLMHRLLTTAPANLQVDHINGDKLDNRRSNLRLCTAGENRRNVGPGRANTSGFKGVCWKPKINKWMASIGTNGKALYLGVFADRMDAARAYDAAARVIHGEFARLNLPEEVGQ